jgi:hypothetical protein
VGYGILYAVLAMAGVDLRALIDPEFINPALIDPPIVGAL